jgi:hypothetical protein
MPSEEVCACEKIVILNPSKLLWPPHPTAKRGSTGSTSARQKAMGGDSLRALAQFI